MKPVSSSIKSNNKCLNPVTTKCVTWDGPEITCLDGTVLCKGQTIENSVYLLASKMCEIYEAIDIQGINTCINNIQDGASISIGSTSTIQQIFSAIINKVCSLNTRVQTLENTDCPEIRAVVPTCLINDTTLPVQVQSLLGWDSTTNTLPIESYASYVAQIICFMLIKINTIQNSIASINQDIQSLWDALNNCTNNCSFNVQPTCTNNFTLNPNNQPVFISDAYTWLETDFCQLQSAIGTSSQITDAISKQCANLNEQDKLSSGGTMENIAGWVNSPVNLADSLSNMWLTVCDMRQAVSQILDGCCFSLCSYLEFGYDITWSQDGTTVTFSVNTPGFATVYTSAAVPAPLTSPYTAAAPGPLPAWVTTQFPIASQTNIVITFDDGVGMQAVWSTGQKLNALAIVSTPISFTFPVGYDYTSINQTINIQFNYDVDDSVTPVVSCEINQTDSLPYECCSPPPVPYDWGYDISSSDGTDMTIIVDGLLESTGLVYPSTGTANPTTIGANTLIDTSATFNAGWATSGEFGYIVRITSGPGAGQVRYITNVNVGADTLTVNQNWDTPLPTTASTYEIQDIYWLFPLNGPDYPCGISAPDPSPLIDLKIQIIEIDSAYNPNDPTNWNIQFQIQSISDIIISTTGAIVSSGVLSPNVDYAVAVFAHYACNYSEPTIYNTVTPIAASVSIQFGTPTAPAPQVFTPASTQVTVDNITNNSPSWNLPDQSVTSQTPAFFALTLPTAGNVTRFELIPGKGVFALTQGQTPINYAICGLNYNPWGTTGAPLNTPNRDIVLGQYRGYDVEIFDASATNTLTPILDACGVPFKTNSLDDPNIAFIYNQPFGFAGPCPVPPVPLCAIAPPIPPCVPGTAGVPITIDIPSTFIPNVLPIIVRYNPANRKVNLSNDFHTITIKAGSRLRINNTGAVNNLTNADLFFYVRVFTFDSSAVAPGWIDYPIPRYNSFPLIPTTSPIGPLVFWEEIVPFDQTVTCKYGDAIYGLLQYDTGSASPPNSSCFIGSGASTMPLTIGPDPTTSQFSCNIPSLVEISTTRNGTALPVITGSTRGLNYKFFVTEDLDISFDVVVNINA